MLRLSAFPSVRIHKSLLAVCFMLFFWTLFDGAVSYISPIAINHAGYTDTVLGLIIGSSSVAGAVFDFLLSKYLRDSNFRRVYLLMFVLCSLFPVILWNAKIIWMFLLAMGVWGLYYDLVSFGTFDFVGRTFREEDHSSSFGIISVFKEFGYTLAPLIAGLTLGALLIIDWKPIFLMYIFLLMSILFFFILFYITRREKEELISPPHYKKSTTILEVSLWFKIGKILSPPLFLTLFFNIFDSFFWTLGPILAESYKALHPFNGLFLTVYTLPFIFIGWFVGPITRKFGKKKTAFASFFIGSFFLSFFFLFHNPYLILGDIFLSSVFIGFTIPAINGAYADYINETPKVEKEIEALNDFSTNLGYFIGPILAGFLADLVGHAQTFSVLGFMCFGVALLLFISSPKKIRVNVS